jgi:hypothetical protein
MACLHSPSADLYRCTGTRNPWTRERKRRCAHATALLLAHLPLDNPLRTPCVLPRADNPFKHGASSALLLLDLGLSRAPVVSYHISVSRRAGGSPG